MDASIAEAEAPLKLYNEAILSVQAGKREKAIKQLKSALSIYPDFMLALNELGVQYIKLQANGTRQPKTCVRPSS